MSQHRSLRIKQLYGKSNRCHYCNCKTILKKDKRGRMLNNTATIEHLYTNHDIRRLLLGKFDHTVLACNKCNMEMGTKAEQLVNAQYKELGSVKPIKLMKFTRKPITYKTKHRIKGRTKQIKKWYRSFLFKNKQTMKTFKIIACVAFILLIGTFFQCIITMGFPNMEVFGAIQWLLQFCYWTVLVYVGVWMGTEDNKEEERKYPSAF